MAKRLDADIREFAEEMQTRRNQAKVRVANQEIIGMRFMDVKDIRARMMANVETVVPGDAAGPRAMQQLADTAVFGLALIEKAKPPAA